MTSSADAPPNVRRAALADAGDVSAIHRLAAVLPPPQSAEENLRYVREQLMAESGRERQLWTFERNKQVRAFYEQHGWVLAETTGQANEQEEPEVRYLWRP